MAGEAPGRRRRKGVAQADFFRRFPDEEAAVQWLIRDRWGDTPTCPHCGSTNVNMKAKHPNMPHRCRARGCRKYFSVKIGTVMECSNLRCWRWLYIAFQLATNPKGASSLKLHRDAGTTWTTAWFAGQRLRHGMAKQTARLTGDIEVDETCMGGKRRNMSLKKRKALAKAGRGAVGKAIVIGAVSRETGKVVVKEIPDTTSDTLHGFVDEVAQEGVAVYTDEHKGCAGLDKKGSRRHETVTHSAGQYVKGNASTNRIESFWALIKRSYCGAWRHVSKKHLKLYISEAAARHNMRDLDAERRMSSLFAGMVGQRLRYADLTA